MSEKVSGIPVKRKINSPSSPSHDRRHGEQHSPPRQISKTEQCIKIKKPQVTGMTETKSNSSEFTNNARSKGVKEGTEPTSENGTKDSPGNSESATSNPDLEIRGTVASFHYNSDQTVLYYIVLVLMTVLAFATRLYKIDVPSWVCWDETHFGKMGSWYINHTFFFDVHPPLGKMMIGLSGYLTGYNGTFPYLKPGDEYQDWTQYVGMRVVCASLGATLVPFVYMSTWLLCKSVMAALFASTFVLFDVGINTLTRYILLDPILMFFIMAATYTLLKFLSYRERPFSLGWWFWMCLTGVFLASAMAVKFVGLFVVLLAGYSTMHDLWRLLGNQTVSMIDLVKHFVARAFGLIVLPIICYMIYFAIHLEVLYKSGPGDGFYSSQFQSMLEGNRLHNVSMPESVAFGSIVSLKHQRTGGSYLHSHSHLYPEESPPRHQQITTYSHKDENNLWRIKQAHSEPNMHESYPVFVRNGDLVRLEHVTTRRNLHSHKEPAPVTSRHFQVTGYGSDGHGDSNDLWQIMIPGAGEQAHVMVVSSKFQLIHYHVKCALHSHDKKLPKWGFEQLEVTCNPNIKDPKTFWSVEEIRDPRLPNVSFAVHAPSFLNKFMESHAVMTQGNSGLKPKEGEVTSRPWQWPINMRGQIFSGKEHRVLLLGNPIIWYGLLVIMALFLLIFLAHSVQIQRGVKISKEVIEFKEHTFSACWWAMAGWALHYLPFWPMTRVLYFHHYFPALLYSCMLGGMVVDCMIKLLCHALPRSLSMVVFHICVGVILSGTAYSFYLFHPMTYGMSGPVAKDGGAMAGLRWIPYWDI